MTHLVDPAMFRLPYMQNAFAAATVVASISGFVGFFVVLRGATFAAHAYAQMGFAGAAAAVLVGADPLLGLIVFAVGGAALNAVLTARERARDVSTALLMVAALGAGALFLVLDNTFATAAFSFLFGSVVGISRTQVCDVTVLAALCALALVLLYRPLLFSSVNLESARARAVPVRFIGIAFSTLLAVTAAIPIPTVGTLLIFSLLVGPAATATRLTRHPLPGIVLAMAIGVLVCWLAIVASYDTSWPVGFFITLSIAVLYALVRIVTARSGDAASAAQKPR